MGNIARREVPEDCLAQDVMGAVAQTYNPRTEASRGSLACLWSGTVRDLLRYL